MVVFKNTKGDIFAWSLIRINKILIDVLPAGIQFFKQKLLIIIYTMRKILITLFVTMYFLIDSGAQGTWTQKANVGGGARYYTTGFVIGTKGYIGTGYDGGLRKDFWEWDQTTNVWTQKADFGGDARDNAVGFSIGTKGYVGVGGYYNGRQFKKDFWEWDQPSNTWIRKADFGGTARILSVGFSIGSKGYIGTGLSATGETKDFWEYDPVNDTWVQKADFNGLPREGAVGLSIGTKGYIGTGNDGASICYKDFWEYDPANDLWIKKADFAGSSRSYSIAFSIGTKGFIGTGSCSTYLADFWEWDQLTNTWIKKADFGGGVRSSATGFAIGNKGYIALGSSSPAVDKQDFWEFSPSGGCSFTVTVSTTNTSCNSPNTGSATANVSGGTPGYQYNWTNGATTQNISGLAAGNYSVIVTDVNGCTATAVASVISTVNSQGTWTQKANFGGLARWGASGFSIGTKAYIGTGYNNGTDMNDLWEWDQTSNVWTQKASLPAAPRRGSIGFSIGNRGYIGTGVNSVFNFFNDLWEYDPASNTWKQKASMPTTGFYGAAGFSIGIKGYVAGGNEGSASGPYSNKLWEYDPLLDTWVQKASFPGTPRYGTRGFATSMKGYFGMGGTVSQFFKDFWEYTPSTNSWNQLPDYPGNGSGYVAGFAIADKVYVGTGQTAGTPYNDFWEFDPGTSKWTSKANYGGGNRWLITGFAIGNKGYFGTGYDFTNYYNDFWEFSPSSGCSPVVTVSTTSVLCNGSNTGSATASVTGGTAPYTYVWNNGATIQAITGLVAGSYSVIVTDMNGNSATGTASISQPPALSLITTANNASCAGADGSISAAVSGGTPGYKYNWSNGATTQNISGLAAGNYSVLVTDANGCSNTANTLIKTVDATAPVAVCKNITVQLNAAGTASIVASDVDGGSADACGILSLSIDKSNFTCSNVGTNNVLLTVTDVNHNVSTCTAIVTVEDRIAPVALCKNITAQLNSSGIARIGVAQIDNGSSDACGIASVGIASYNFTTLLTDTFFYCPGQSSYSVTLVVIDNNGNSSTCQSVITVEDHIVPTIICPSDIYVTSQPNDCKPVVTWNAVKATDNCSAAVSSNYHSGDHFPVGTTKVIYTATDPSGNSSSCSFNVIVTPQPLAVTVSATNASCNGPGQGSATANASGGCLPYTYSWSTSPVQTTKTATNLSAGTYTLKVTDANGTSLTSAVTISSVSLLVADAGLNQTVYYGYSPGSSATLNGSTSQGTSPYKYKWSTGATSASIKVSPSTGKQYTLTVTDANGCVARDVVKVCVVDVRCDKSCHSTGGKVEICHKAANGKKETLCVSASAVPAHLAHGDKLGRCGAVTSCLDDSKAGEEEENPIAGNEINLVAYPNPLIDETTVRFNTLETEQVEVAVYNLLGIKIATVFEGMINGMEIHEEKFNAAALSNGIYFVKLVTGQGEIKAERIVVNR